MTKYAAATCIAVVFGAFSASADTCGGLYNVGRGDSLSQIADKLYKDVNKWSLIYRNNIKLIGEDPNDIKFKDVYLLPCIGGLPTGLEGGKEMAKAPASAPKEHDQHAKEVESHAKVTPPKNIKHTAAQEVVIEAEEEAETKKTAGTDDTVVTDTAMAKKIDFSASPGPLKLLVADNYAPFLGRESYNNGMIQDLVLNAFASNPNVGPVKSYWINDWSAHLDPLLSDAIMDVGYPWLKPDCISNSNVYRCQNFLFSEPVFDMLIMLFTNKNHPVTFNKDNDILGKKLCRPKGYYTHDLDKNGRNWLKGKKIILEQPSSLASCFKLLGEGEVDAVVINEFTGRAQIKKLGLADSVEVVQSRPLSIEGHYVVVHKSHPNAIEIIEMVNESLAMIKESGKYQEVIDEHLSKIWAEF